MNMEMEMEKLMVMVMETKMKWPVPGEDKSWVTRDGHNAGDQTFIRSAGDSCNTRV